MRVETSFSVASLFLLSFPILLFVSCAGPQGGEPVPVSQRLVDVFSQEMVHAAADRSSSGESEVAPPVPEPAQWRFDGALEAPLAGWEAQSGVADLAIENGRLVGRTTGPLPILRLSIGPRFPHDDVLYEVEVRLAGAAGDKVGVHCMGAEPKDFDHAVLSAPQVPWPSEGSLATTGEVQTLTLKPLVPVVGRRVETILLRPASSEGVRFEIESVRLTFRREHLAAIPSGIGWQGLSELYREAVTARSPEVIRWPVTLPAKPRLSLALGTLDERPVTFRVRLQPEGEGPETLLMERTVTTPQRWEDVELDLAEGAVGRQAVVALELVADEPGTLGLWGAPAVRRRGPLPAVDGEPRPQGVVFILADTLRPDRLDAYGHGRPTAPAVAALASEGTRFDHAVAQGTWTKVSAPSILTSLYPSTTGVHDFFDRVPASATTLAEAFRAGGYATMGFSAVPFTGRFSNLHQGYEELSERAMDPQSSKTARSFVDRLLPWLERHRDVPFFVFLHIFDPHSPYEPASPYDTLWADPAWHEEHRQELNKARPFIKDPMMQMAGMPRRDELEEAGIDPETYIQREMDWYDGSVRGMDAEIGRILERLRELGLEDDTLVVFASDHGEEFHEHGRMFHAQTVYGELTRVPWILRWPRGLAELEAPAVVDETVQMIDLMPTLLDLAGLAVPEAAQGQSTEPLLRPAVAAARPWRSRPAVSEKPAVESITVPPPRDTESFALVYEGWKLIHNTRRPEGAAEFELYDAEDDPLDTADVAAEHPEVVTRLAGLLDSWHQDALAQRLPPDEATAADLDPEQLERLRALGYVN